MNINQIAYRRHTKEVINLKNKELCSNHVTMNELIKQCDGLTPNQNHIKMIYSQHFITKYL